MARRSFTEGNWRKDPWFAALCRAVAACKGEKEVAAFLRDVGTLSELQAWSERLEVARQIRAGKTYRDINKSTGASTTTITRVAKFLDGKEGGYTKVLKTSKKNAHHHASAPRGERMASMSR